MDDMEIPWLHLPEELYVLVFRELACEDRLIAASVCTMWNHAFKSGTLWKNLTVQFKDDEDKHLKQVALRYGMYFERLQIKCYQQSEGNAENACAFLDILCNHESLRLSSFKLELCETNPFFYDGGRFLGTLESLFNSPAIRRLRSLDFSKLPIAFTDELLEIITRNVAPNIECFNIQNKVLCSRLSPKSLVNFIQQAHKLKHLSIRSTYFTTDVLNVITENKLTNLKLISLLFTRADKFLKIISGNDWLKMSEVLPQLRVSMKFDHTFPMHCTYQVMLPEIPMSILKLCLHAICHQHVNMATAMYKKTLEKLVVKTTPSTALDDAVLRLVTECQSVKDVHVHCRMDQKVVKQIHGAKRLRRYTLPYIDDCTTIA